MRPKGTEVQFNSYTHPHMQPQKALPHYLLQLIGSEMQEMVTKCGVSF